jgi:AraC-like DNA-binding protein
MNNCDLPKVYLYRRLVLAKLYIEQNYASKLDLAIIADEACFSKYHFIRLFNQLYGKTPHQYLIALRIAKARKLLMTETAVAEVCFAIGFESISTFTTLFRKVAGLTPAAYKALQIKKRNEVKQAPLKFVPGCFARNFS